MEHPLKILILEDSSIDAEIIQRLLRKQEAPYEFHLAMNKKSFSLALENFCPEVILSDNSLPGFNAADALKITRQRYPLIPFILVTGTVSEEYAANIIKEGADDYVLKDRIARLPVAISTALKQRRIEKEKLEAIEKMIESEGKYRTIFLKSPLPKWIYDHETLQFLDVNEAAIELYGYTREEFLNMTIKDIRPKEDIEMLLDDVKKVVVGADVRRGQWRHLRKSGELIIVETRAHSIDYHNRKTRMVIAIDITEKLKAEEKIIQSESNLKAIFDNTSEGFILTDAQGVVKTFNNRAQNFRLISPEEIMVGKNIFDFIEDSRKEFFKTIFSRVVLGETIQYDRPYTEPEGSITWISFTFNPVKKNGLIDGMCITGLDITEKKIAEEEKEFDTNNLKALINNTKDLMWSVDSDLKLITFNDSFNEVITFMSGQPLVKGGNVLSTHFTEDQLNRYKIIYQRAFSGESFTITDHFESPVEVWAEISFYPIRNGDAVIGTACFSRDITERKKAEENLKLLEQKILEQKIQEQKKVAQAMITSQEQERNHLGKELHDNINQILAGTKMYLSMAGKKNEAVKEVIKYPMELLDTSIREIRLLCSKMVTPLKNIDLEDLIMDVISKINLNEKIKTTFTYVVPEKLLSDELKLNIYRIIQEQVNNMLKYADARNVDISIKTEDKTIQIIVEDDGKGFDISIKRKGIGISNMINRVETFNGNVKIKSSPGNGCKVNITMPF